MTVQAGYKVDSKKYKQQVEKYRKESKPRSKAFLPVTHPVTLFNLKERLTSLLDSFKWH